MQKKDWKHVKHMPAAWAAFTSLTESCDQSMHRCLKYSYQHRNNLTSFLPRGRDRKGNMFQSFDNFLILDFEATCDKYRTISPQEIIEFPCLRMSTKSLEIKSRFHRYVLPVRNPELTPFCVELTGILQEMLVGQPTFTRCIESFHDWLVLENILESRFVFITCGDWDLKVMLPAQCKLAGIPVPPYMRQWINIKKTFGEATGLYGHGLMAMLKMLNLKHVGRHHSGIDDCQNIANIVRELALRHRFIINSMASE